MKKLFYFSLFVGTKNNDLLCTAAKCGSCAILKMWIRESKNVIVYNFVKKYTRFIFFVSIFCFICNSDFYKDLQFAFGVELKK